MLKDGHLLIFDFSIPLETFEQLVHDTKQFLGNSVKRVTGFGHLGISYNKSKLIQVFAHYFIGYLQVMVISI